MLSRYQSIFYPNGPEPFDFDWYMASLLSQPTEALIQEYWEQVALLKELRRNEPTRKRRNRSKYRVWVQLTQDKCDRIEQIARELNTRQAKANEKTVIFPSIKPTSPT